MTKRDYLIYTLRICGLWLLTYWRRIVFVVGVIVVVFLLTSCTVGTLPTPQLTNTPALLPTLTASPMPSCEPGQDITIDHWSLLWEDSTRDAAMGLVLVGTVWEGWRSITLSAGDTVQLVERSGDGWRVQVWDSPVLVGWIPLWALPGECQ